MFLSQPQAPSIINMTLLVFSDQSLEASFRAYFHKNAKPVALWYSVFLNVMHLVMLVRHFRQSSVPVDTASYVVHGYAQYPRAPLPTDTPCTLSSARLRCFQSPLLACTPAAVAITAQCSGTASPAPYPLHGRPPGPHPQAATQHAICS